MNRFNAGTGENTRFHRHDLVRLRPGGATGRCFAPATARYATFWSALTPACAFKACVSAVECDLNELSEVFPIMVNSSNRPYPPTATG